MDDTTLIYKPNHAYKSIAAVLIVLTLFFGGMAFSLWNLKNTSIMLLLGLGSAIVACYFYRESTATLFIRKHGIEITVLGKIVSRYPWNFYKYTYTVRNYRGFWCLLLSPRALTEKEQRTQVYFRTIYTKNYRDGVLAVYIDGGLVEEIQSRIAEHT